MEAEPRWKQSLVVWTQGFRVSGSPVRGPGPFGQTMSSSGAHRAAGGVWSVTGLWLPLGPGGRGPEKWLPSLRAGEPRCGSVEHSLPADDGAHWVGGQALVDAGVLCLGGVHDDKVAPYQLVAGTWHQLHLGTVHLPPASGGRGGDHPEWLDPAWCQGWCEEQRHGCPGPPAPGAHRGGLTYRWLEGWPGHGTPASPSPQWIPPGIADRGADLQRLAQKWPGIPGLNSKL